MNPSRKLSRADRSRERRFLAALREEAGTERTRRHMGMDDYSPSNAFAKVRRKVLAKSIRETRKKPIGRFRRTNPSEADVNRRFEDLAGGPSRAFALMRLAERARQAVSGDRFSYSRPQRSAKTVFKEIAKREGFPKRAADYYAANFM